MSEQTPNEVDPIVDGAAYLLLLVDKLYPKLIKPKNDVLTTSFALGRFLEQQYEQLSQGQESLRPVLEKINQLPLKYLMQSLGVSCDFPGELALRYGFRHKSQELTKILSISDGYFNKSPKDLERQLLSTPLFDAHTHHGFDLSKDGNERIIDIACLPSMYDVDNFLETNIPNHVISTRGITIEIARSSTIDQQSIQCTKNHNLSYSYHINVPNNNNVNIFIPTTNDWDDEHLANRINPNTQKSHLIENTPKLFTVTQLYQVDVNTSMCRSTHSLYLPWHIFNKIDNEKISKLLTGQFNRDEILTIIQDYNINSIKLPVRLKFEDI